MGAYEVETISVDGRTTAVGSAGAFTVVVDRPVEGGGGGKGFNGGQLLNLAVAGCVSNDLFREAAKRGIALLRVRVTADADYAGDPAVSTPITYDVELEGEASEDALRELLDHVDNIAEIPNSLRSGTEVRLGSVRIDARNG
jgi:organic hydroperoxide reductase OsmC/OhrA